VPPGTHPPTGATYASWGRRLGGWLIDWVILAAVGAIIAVPAHGWYSTTDFAGNSSFHIRPWFISIQLVIILVYGTVLCGSRRGQTVGMMAVGVRAVDMGAGGPIGYGRALWRAFFEQIMYVFFVIPWIVDMLWPLWDNRNQTLHDKVSNTAVVVIRR
jgi:uncharacterized RDD family membrane protein YckC